MGKGTRPPKRPQPLNQPRSVAGGGTAQLEALFRRHPALRAAYTSARERFEELPGVCGIGVGPPFSEQEGVYRPGPDDLDGLCIKVYVQQKKESLPGRQRIPRWLTVQVPGKRARRRVPVDVVMAGELGEPGGGAARMRNGRGWPTAGKLTPGRLFAFGRSKAEETPSLLDENDVELGTSGALLRMSDGRSFAVSAGHVFTRPCAGLYAAPQGRRAVGAKERRWQTVPDGQFFPGTLLRADRVRDAMCFRVPDELKPDDASWPDGFLKELATSADIDRAIRSTEPLAFLWVERRGMTRPQAIPVDLEAAIPFFKARVQCGNAEVEIPYMLTWPLRFTSGETTLGGDSGAGVFVWTEQNAFCRLLGFHFLEWGAHSYAMDAREFFLEALGEVPGGGIQFA